MIGKIPQGGSTPTMVGPGSDNNTVDIKYKIM
jgi:hypothetical protein